MAKVLPLAMVGRRSQNTSWWLISFGDITNVLLAELVCLEIGGTSADGYIGSHYNSDSNMPAQHSAVDSIPSLFS
jgi:hypothetical protein